MRSAKIHRHGEQAVADGGCAVGNGSGNGCAGGVAAKQSERQVVAAGGGAAGVIQSPLVSERRPLGADGGDLGVEGAEQGQRRKYNQFVFHGAASRRFTVRSEEHTSE